MKMSFKKLVPLLTPPVFIHLAKKLRGKLSTSTFGLIGDFHSWEEAMAASTGYDSDLILEKTKAALIKVKNRNAAYERDSVLFDKIHYSWPLLAGLMWVAAQNKGSLNVLDFGGSFGSTYFQNRFFLSSLSTLRWNIVEQPAHVRVGKELFEDNSLKFYGSVDECVSDTTPNVVLLSGVLQYLKNPYEIITTLFQLPGITIIIDRTPFWNGDHDKLRVQRVDPNIFDASYPIWVLSLHNFRRTLASSTIFEEFECFENGLFDLVWKGFIIRSSE